MSDDVHNSRKTDATRILCHSGIVHVRCGVKEGEDQLFFLLFSLHSSLSDTVACTTVHGKDQGGDCPNGNTSESRDNVGGFFWFCFLPSDV